MDPCRKKYPADFFKKDLNSEADDNIESQSVVIHREDCEAEASTDGETSSESEISSENEVEEEFNNEDRLISRLYREVVDDLMASNKLSEKTVDAAIDCMRQEIFQGHKKGFRRFLGIDFCRPENCCGYLRRYAICHTGLVKKILWNFFLDKMPLSRTVKDKIINTSHLKVVALGGGPGNDLVGFCCALQEIPNTIRKLDLIIVDINKGWKSVFPKILRKAKCTDYGSFSLCLRKKIVTGFMEADLTNHKIFEDESLSLLLGQSDVVLMVKLTSFLCTEEADALINNVVNSMKPDAILIFIDQPYDSQFFRGIKSLNYIYHDYIKYELCFNPLKSRSPAISNSQAHVAILKKKIVLTEESSENEET